MLTVVLFSFLVQVHTYAVTAVFDPLLNTDVSFADALRRGLIDRDTGTYVDRRDPGHYLPIPVTEAMARGLLRARIVTDEDAEFGLAGSRAAERKHALVVERIDRIRRHVMKGLRVINAFKAAGAAKGGDEKAEEAPNWNSG